MITVKWSDRVIYRIVETPHTPEDDSHPACFIVTIRRTSMLLDEAVLNALMIAFGSVDAAVWSS